MTSNGLVIQDCPKLSDGRMVLAFSGWMDGGDVSTGSVDWLAKVLGARPVGSIRPEGYYIYNFPGSMEVSALFRPSTRIEDGVIASYEPPENTFLCDEDSDLILFRAKEPNFHWDEFANCIFSFAARAEVTTIYFVGSYGGSVPHTREPRLRSTVSDESLKPGIERHGIAFTNYEGPASFSTHLLAGAKSRGFRMASLVAEIPGYIQGTNPACIEAMLKRLTALLGLQLDLRELRSLSEAWEEKLGEAVKSETELLEHIAKLEANYDNEIFDTQMGDLKEWLEQKGIRVD